MLDPPIVLICPECGACEGEDELECPFCGASTIIADGEVRDPELDALLPSVPPASI
jgi:hypothetical protein